MTDLSVAHSEKRMGYSRAAQLVGKMDRIGVDKLVLRMDRS
jgi:hypothetical protein